ncbi:hypothetical protein [endosymbiont GvMRE of Glomus versiforme]|uniref:hypothetical protein n=1 Tax=endosymbiont GvMRE of Glomus versiforme TaxID=2039283 RepID=UPI000EBD829C|nr:hypothetical protein [endosymbiont GvMRE of Glomus versiforme]RHZ37451.1 hypothetical protein GvMRE_I1g375 [endosymbiont GvMRE of Glomus versiforme]
MNEIKENGESSRTKQLGLKVKEDFYWKVKEMALKRRCHIVELIEESVEFFQKKKKKKREREREREREQKRPRSCHKSLKIRVKNY